MKARYIAAIVIGSGLSVWALVSCNLNAVSIGQRISDFQSDLNTSDRSNVYNDFHPTETQDYNALKDPVTSSFNTNFPPPTTTNYTLSVVSDSNTSAVIVAVNSGPTGVFGAPPYYLSLRMDTYNNNDWRIVTLSASTNQNGPYTQVYQ